MNKIRERLSLYGAESLHDEELLALLLDGSTHTVVLLRQFLHDHGGLAGLRQLHLADVAASNLRDVDVEPLYVLVELIRRFTQTSVEHKPQIRSAYDAYALFKPEVAHLDHEELWVMLLDSKNYVLAKRMLFKGTVNSSVIRVAELFRPAVIRNSPSIVICHNHPSGDPTPSEEDIAMTQHCVAAGKLFEIEVLDHLILGGNRYHSLKEQLRW